MKSTNILVDKKFYQNPSWNLKTEYNFLNMKTIHFPVVACTHLEFCELHYFPLVGILLE